MRGAPDADDASLMALALRLARRGLGRVAPNPAVGCLIVRHGRVVGRGWTQPGGRPHAEAEALTQAGEAARGATVYVTLEPCAHHGQTPPCAEALIAAGVARVVVACEDPDPRTAGKGLAQLRAAGIETVCGVATEAARALNAGFFLRQTAQRPMVALKLATSLDGRIASRTGHSRWITGAAARRHGHMLRATHDAILIGAGTLAADNPALTCRLPGLEDRSPIRIVLGGAPQALASSKLAQQTDIAPVWHAVAGAGDGAPADRGGMRRFHIAGDDDAARIHDLLRQLAMAGVTRLLVEGGASTAAGFLCADAVDRLYLYRAGTVIGGDGLASIGSLGVRDVARDTPKFRLLDTQPLGGDVLDVYERAEQ
mgnify:CR=1 FL=1